jgi:predicted RNase H-like nuclease (RuvC/YqgF family)
MTQQIERLERELEAVKVERNDERARSADLALKAAQVEVLNAILEAERRQADELRHDRDRWAVQAHALAHPPGAVVPGRRGWFGWGRKRA